MGAGVVFDAWVSYGRCDLAHEKSANAQARIAKVFERAGPRNGVQRSPVQSRTRCLGNVKEN